MLFNFVAEYFNPNDVKTTFLQGERIMPNTFFCSLINFTDPTSFYLRTTIIGYSGIRYVSVDPGISTFSFNVEFLIKNQSGLIVDYIPDGNYTVVHRYLSGSSLTLQFLSGEVQYEISLPSWDSQSYIPKPSSGSNCLFPSSESPDFISLSISYSPYIIIALGIVIFGISSFFFLKFRKQKSE